MRPNLVLMLLISLSMPGCGKPTGPETGAVSGVVLLDGQPLSGATIRFIPQVEGSMTSGRTSLAVTDAEGRYELEYSASKSGAMIGSHLVKISTQRTAGEDEEGNPLPPVEEKVPVEYNIEAAKNSEMTKEVKAGSNEINFDLKGGGKIVQRPKEDTD